MSVKIDRTPLDLLVTSYLRERGEESNLFYKILIPSNDANELYKYLRRIGYDASRLFPGYYGAVKSIEERALALYKLEEHVQLSK